MQNPPYWDRFWAKVDASGDCWLWTASLAGGRYGKCKVEGKSYLAHRLAWTLLVGPIPEGMQIDHLCRVLTCVNPDHLELVTGRTNLLRGYGFPGLNARKTECPVGHPLIGDNLYEGYKARFCKTCYRKKKREAGMAKRRADRLA